MPKASELKRGNVVEIKGVHHHVARKRFTNFVSGMQKQARSWMNHAKRMTCLPVWI